MCPVYLYIWAVHHDGHMPDSTSRSGAFFAELRRRRVFRVAAFYGGIAFVIIQIIDGTFDLMGAPEWAGRIIVVLLGIGFPITMILAWVFDITPEGIVRTEGPSTGSGRQQTKPGTSNRALIAVTVAAIAFGIWGRWGDQGSTPGQIRSIAVIPLSNLMNDPEQDYFVDGMHEAIISKLSRIEALKVISRTSTLGYRNTRKRMPQIASELKVDAIVEGSVLKAANKVRITVQLISGLTDEHLWSGDYERDLDDILALQNEVATAIAEEIKITMTPGERTRLAESRKVSPEAHEHYLKGLHHWNRRTRDGFGLALEDFQASVDADPSYAPAYAGLALTYQLLGEYSIIPINESAPQVISLAEQALRLDPNLAEAHTALAAARVYYLHDWAGAEAGYEKAIELNPGYATAYQWLAELNATMGNYEKALANIDRAKSLDPLSNIIHVTRASALTFLGRHAEAIAQHEERIKLYPGIGQISFWYVRTLLQAGRFDAAVDLDLKILRQFTDSTGVASARLRKSYRQGGFESYAKEWISVMSENDWNYDAEWIWSVSWRQALAGSREATLASLERDLRDNSVTLSIINTFPEYEFLREEPRFQAIIREIGLEP